MTHLHLPDGVIPWPWLALGFALTAVLLALSGRRIPRQDLAARVPAAAVVAALMVLGMSVPLGFIPFHTNLTVLAGILLGPALGFVAAVAVNVILALMGHGGITVVGINSLITGFEVAAGALLFAALRRRLSPVASAAVATAATLVVSFALIVGAAALAGANPAALARGDEHDHAAGAPAAPQAGAADHSDADHGEAGHGASLGAFAAAVAPVFATGVAIESAAVAAVVGYLARVRPGLLYGSSPQP